MNPAGIARHCESAPAGSRALDAEIYEALGFEVVKAGSPGSQFHYRYRGVGHLLRGSARWVAMARLTTSVDQAVLLLEPGTGWSVTRVHRGYFAAVDRFSADAATAALALCALGIKIFAARGGYSGPLNIHLPRAAPRAALGP